MQDHKLVEQFQTGEFSAFGELYERYIDAIYAFIYRKTSDTQVAEDLTSEVFMKAMKKLESFSEKKGASFKSWIYTIANNTVIDYYRVQKVNIDIESMGEIGIQEDFSQALDDKSKLEEVQAFLEQLKPLEREIVILRVWDELSYKEISEMTGKTVDNCKQIYKRTLDKIKGNIHLFIFFLLLL